MIQSYTIQVSINSNTSLIFYQTHPVLPARPSDDPSVKAQQWRNWVENRRSWRLNRKAWHTKCVIIKVPKLSDTPFRASFMWGPHRSVFFLGGQKTWKPHHGEMFDVCTRVRFFVFVRRPAEPWLVDFWFTVVWQINIFLQTRNGSGKLPLHMGKRLDQLTNHKVSQPGTRKYKFCWDTNTHQHGQT